MVWLHQKWDSVTFHISAALPNSPASSESLHYYETPSVMKVATAPADNMSHVQT